MTQDPGYYLFIGFNKINFPDLFDPLWMVSGVMLIVLIALYVLRTRALHRHKHYLDMWEWLFWSGLITWFLVIVGSIFQFDFAVILVILVVGPWRDGLGEIPEVPAAVRGIRAPARPPALPRPLAELEAGGDDPHEGRPPARQEALTQRR